MRLPLLAVAAAAGLVAGAITLIVVMSPSLRRVDPLDLGSSVCLGPG